jgi:hypothetical protein
MATPYFYGQNILQDALFRAGESVALSGSTSPYLDAAKRYLWRAYTDFLKVYPWTYAIKYPPGVLDTVAEVTGTATCTKGSTTVTLGATVAASLAGRKFYIDTEKVPYRIASHTGGTDAVTLDATYKEDSVSGGAYTVFQDELALGTDVLRIWDAWHRNNPAKHFSIRDRHNMNRLWPNRLVSTTVGPNIMAVIADKRVRIRPWTEEAETIEYDYTPVPAELDYAGSTTDTPIIPEEDRHILADMTLYYLFVDKSEPRANQILKDIQVNLTNLISIREPVKFRMSPSRKGSL